MRANDARELITTIAPITAAQAICSRAHDGLIEARATRLIVGEKSVDGCPVGADFWWARGGLALKQNWAAGDFETWINHKVHCRAYGVEFRRSDIEAMMPPRQSISFSRAQPGNYSPAFECVTELQKSLGCSEGEAQSLILRHCRAGTLPAQCASIFTRIRNGYGDDVDEQEHVSVPEWFWEQGIAHQDSILDWQTGRFTGRAYIDGDDLKVRIEGVEFQVGAIVDLEAMELRKRKARDDELAASQARPATVAPPRDERPLGKRWPVWIAELVCEVHDHGFPEGIGSQGQEELITRVADALAKRGVEGLGRTTVQSTVQAVLDRYRAAEK